MQLQLDIECLVVIALVDPWSSHEPNVNANIRPFCTLSPIFLLPRPTKPLYGPLPRPQLQGPFRALPIWLEHLA